MRRRNLFDSAGRTSALLALYAFVITGCAAEQTAVGPDSRAGGGTPGTSTQVEAATPEVAGARAAPTGSVPAVATPTLPAPSPTPAAEVWSPAPGSFPSFELSNYTFRPGETATLRGQGFQPGERVRVYLSTDPQSNLAEAQVDGSGRFTVQEFLLPGSTSGDRTVTVEGESSGLRVERTLSTVGYSPWVTLDRYALKPGETIGFSGHDFAPGEQVQVYLDDHRDKPLAEVKADDRGEASSPSMLTAGPADVGKHRLTFVGQTTGSNLPVEFEVLGYTPEMGLTSYAGQPGALVAFDGKGFAPGETIKAYAGQGEKRTQVATFQADSRGEISHAGEFRVPMNVAVGPLPLTVEGDQSKVPVGQTFKVDREAPWIGLSGYSGQPGTELAVQAEGFGANEPVDVYLNDGKEKVASGETDILGAARVGPVTIPSDSSGPIAVTLKGEMSGATARATFDVTR